MVSDEMQRVEAAVRKKGKNLAWLADQINVNNQDLNNWKNRGIPKNKLILVADFFHWSVDWLLRGDPALSYTEGVEDQKAHYKINSTELVLLKRFRYLSKQKQDAWLILMDSDEA